MRLAQLGRVGSPTLPGSIFELSGTYSSPNAAPLIPAADANPSFFRNSRVVICMMTPFSQPLLKTVFLPRKARPSETISLQPSASSSAR